MPRKRNIPNAVRREVCRRYGAEPGTRVDVKCHYCDHVGAINWPDSYRYWPMVSELEFDHYVPESAGGPATAANLVLACRRCNRSKATSIPAAPQVVEA